MKVSIVTISYNQAPFLEQAICSVIGQGYSDIEYIVVDPGSTDGSREIIERYRDRIDKVIFEPDDGPADGLNKGFAMATGDIYGFLNSDDYYLEDAIERIASSFQTNPEKDVISGNVFVVDGSGKLVRRFYSRKFSLIRAAYRAATLAQQATFFRARCFKKSAGFNPDNRIAWDGELWIDMALAGARFSRIDEFLAAFRVHGGCITSKAHPSLEYRLYLDDMFRKVRGRDKTRFDHAIRIALKGLEYMENPKMLVDRLLCTPLMGLKQ